MDAHSLLEWVCDDPCHELVPIAMHLDGTGVHNIAHSKNESSTCRVYYREIRGEMSACAHSVISVLEGSGCFKGKGSSMLTEQLFAYSLAPHSSLQNTEARFQLKSVVNLNL
jgi:hypothetical protein